MKTHEDTPTNSGSSEQFPIRDFDDISQDHYEPIQLNPPITEEEGSSEQFPIRDFDDISQDHYEPIQLNPPITEEEKLYHGATLSKFQFELLLLNMQATHGWSNSSMDSL